MKVTHTYYPVTYVAEKGRRRDTLYSWKPSGKEYWVGEPIEIVAEHVEEVVYEQMYAAIDLLKQQIREIEAQIEAGGDENA